ncbi:SLC13 family permease [candidate division KSB1 bacterium]
MTPEIIFILALTAAAIVMFASDRIRVDLVALLIMSVLLLSRIITPDEGLSGFSNTATVTIGAMFVISAGLYRTGAVNSAGILLLRMGKKNIWVAVAAVAIAIGFVSAFINNTAAVAIFLPVLITLARDLNVSPGRLLMPLSYASMFGGTCTLIGTSTNILVSSIASRHGLQPIGMFEMSGMGIIFFASGFIYMMTAGIKLIPDRKVEFDLTSEFNMNEYLAEIELLENAKSAGKSLESCTMFIDLDVSVLEIKRGEYRNAIPSPKTILKTGDVLKVRANVEKIKKIQEIEGIYLRQQTQWCDLDLKTGESFLFEAVIAPNSNLTGKTLQGIGFRDVYGATVLAIRHHGKTFHERLDTVKLRPGDTLLIEAKHDHKNQLLESGEFVMVSDVGLPQFRKSKIIPAFAIIAGVVLLSALNILPIVVAALAGAGAFVLTGCITLDEAYKAVDWKVIFLLAGVITLGVAIEKTGAADLLSESLIGIAGSLGPVALLSAFYFFTVILTSVISNAAAAAMLVPIAIAAAESIGVDPRPFIMAVMFAASASFMTPVGYQTNLMIFEPGHFKFMDFIRVGGPLTLLFWIIATVFIPVFWPF